MLALTFEAKTLPALSSSPVTVVADAERFTSGAWKPDGKEFLANFDGGLTVILNRDQAKALFDALKIETCIPAEKSPIAAK